MSKSRLFIGLFLLLLVVLITSVILYIRPTEQHTLSYTNVSWQDKLQGMAETRRAEIILTEQEVNQLAKKELVEYLAEHTLPVEVTGAEFRLYGNQITSELNVTRGFLDAAITASFRLNYSSGQLELYPESVAVKGISLPPGTVRLEPVTIDLQEYLPDVVKVQEIDFLGKSIKLKFSLDWLEVARYLKLI